MLKYLIIITAVAALGICMAGALGLFGTSAGAKLLLDTVSRHTDVNRRKAGRHTASQKHGHDLAAGKDPNQKTGTFHAAAGSAGRSCQHSKSCGRKDIVWRPRAGQTAET